MIQSISLLAFAFTVAFADQSGNSQRNNRGNNVGFGRGNQQGFPFPYNPSNQFNDFPAFPFPYYPSYPDYQLYPPTQGGAMNYAQKPVYDTKGSYGGAHSQYNVGFMQPQEQPFIPSLPGFPWETNYLFQYGYPFILKERLNGDEPEHDDKSPRY